MRATPIIITRAEPGAEETHQRLRELGLNAIKSPVLRLAPDKSVPIPPTETLSGLIFTSANGVRTFAARAEVRSLPAWCVGPATATAARDAGFGKVYESAGNAVDLAAFIQDRTPPSDKALLHVANSAAKGDLKRALVAGGYNVKFCPLYAMQPAHALSTEAQEAISQRRQSIVLIHSAKGAEAFARLVQGDSAGHLTAIAISKTASQPLNTLPIERVFIAEAPHEDGLIAALETALATLSA